MKKLTLLTLSFLLCAGSVIAEDRRGLRAADTGHDVNVLTIDGKLEKAHRCGSAQVSPETRATVQHELARYLEESGTLQKSAGNIDVVWHVVYKQKNGVQTGNIPQQWINDQIDHMNAEFAGTGFSFTLISTDRTRNNKWYNRCDRWGPEVEMKSTLAVSPATTLNVYTCSGGSYLGYAYYPWDFAEGDYMHGVVLRDQTLPGGSAAPYAEGDTAVHEIGHYLGLTHTFDNGCSAPGDEVSDTPAEASSASGCPIGRDTCPGGGPDPIHNFMDYSDDACLYEFTNGQVNRMVNMTNLYRPNLI